MTDMLEQPGSGLLFNAMGQAEPWISWDLSRSSSHALFRGTVERVDVEGVGGWCVNLSADGQPAYLALRLAGIDLCVAETQMQRPDVAAAAQVTGPCGYMIPWTDVPFRALTPTEMDLLRALPGDAVAPVEIWVADQGLRLGRLPQGRFSLTVDTLLGMIDDQAALAAAMSEDRGAENAVTGALDGLRANALFGWAHRRNDPAPVTVAMCVDGAVVATAVADGEREDLAALGMGAAAFHLAIPSECHDGRLHRLEVRTLPDGVLLPGGPLQTTLSILEDACWWVEGATLRGWALPAVTGRMTLQLYADGGAPAARVELDTVCGELVRWRVALPSALHDDRPHMLSLRCQAEANRRLRHADGQETCTFRSRVRANIDVVADGVIHGWAYAVDYPPVVLSLSLLDGDQCLWTGEAGVPRPDVNAAFGIAGDHGFTIPWPPSLLKQRPQALRLVVDGEEVALPDILTQTTCEIWPPAALLPRGVRFDGAVDRIDHQGLSGWAVDRLAPDQPVQVAILLDGDCVGTVVADGFEKRLQPVGGTGYHGFRFTFPARVMNGAKRRIEVVVTGTSQRLPVSGQPEPHIDRLFPLIDMLPPPPPPDQALAVQSRLRGALPRPSVSPLPADGDILVSLIVLNWNGSSLLKAMLSSVATWLPARRLEIILVDHASTDDSLAVARGFEDRLNIRILARDANYSFAASNNLAAQQATGRYLFFVNNDIAFTGDVLPGLVAWLDQRPGVGAVGLRLLEPLPDGPGWRFAAHHNGIRFRPGHAGDVPAYVPTELDDTDLGALGAAHLVPAVTAASMLCRKDDFLAVGGFDESYFYGMEDVDLCLRLLAIRGLRSVCDTALVALHHRSVTRTARLTAAGQPNPIMRAPESQKRNHQLFQARFRRQLTRAILLDLLQSAGQWRTTPLRVVFLVTDAGWETPAGDFYTAAELAQAMRDAFGWEVLFARQGTKAVPGADILVAMRHDTDIRQLASANPGVVTIAWMRNRIDEWINAPHLDAFHLLFCSSRKAMDAIRQATGRTSILLPIATNPQRFKPQPRSGGETILFTGNYWGVPRGGLDLLTDPELRARLQIYGHGWQSHPGLRAHWQRPAAYRELPALYARSAITIDDGHPVTRDWNSLNSRVFDALAAGCLVLTNSRDGAEELFDGQLPTYADAKELNSLCHLYLTDAGKRRDLTGRLRDHVLRHHTYAHRAETVRQSLLDWAKSGLRFAIKIGVPDAAQREQWGDWHFALGLARALRKAGHHARIDLLPDWQCPLTVSDDVVIVLRGLSRYEPSPAHINLMWLISHPDEVGEEEMAGHDHVFVASLPYAQKLRTRMGDKVSALLQCTDPDLFHPDGKAPADADNVLFVGNSRGVRRPVVDAAIAAGVNPVIHGSGWTDLIAPHHVRSRYLPNSDLRRHYAAARLVLNDHWPDMRREGFISNRLFDAAASGAIILSDNVAGMAEIFGNAVATFDAIDDFGDIAAGILAEPDLWRERAKTLSELIRANHSFDKRVSTILQVLDRVKR